VSERAQLLLPIADDELILGWRDSEWTGIAPLLEEDVAFSSISQNEIGHARALYELVARERGITADELAFDRAPDEYRCSRLVELRLLDWEKTIARHYLYEGADAARLERLKQSGDAEIAGLAAKIDREEAYHRMHAQMWFDRLKDEPHRLVGHCRKPLNAKDVVGVRDRRDPLCERRRIGDFGQRHHEAVEVVMVVLCFLIVSRTAVVDIVLCADAEAKQGRGINFAVRYGDDLDGARQGTGKDCQRAL